MPLTARGRPASAPPPSAVTAASGVEVHSGWLTKPGGFLGVGATKRWCVLYKDALFCMYEGEDLTKVKDSFKLRGAKIVVADLMVSIREVDKSAPMKLKAPSKAEAAAWAQALQAASGGGGGGGGGGGVVAGVYAGGTAVAIAGAPAAAPSVSVLPATTAATAATAAAPKPTVAAPAPGAGGGVGAGVRTQAQADGVEALFVSAGVSAAHLQRLMSVAARLQKLAGDDGAMSANAEMPISTNLEDLVGCVEKFATLIQLERLTQRLERRADAIAPAGKANGQAHQKTSDLTQVEQLEAIVQRLEKL
uniref:PH domain-containing protein n=1 Tax=Chrysotila carterae TaxID=13221 RepID=A0A6S9ZFU8_CHRCT